jgi:large subunit ribosomal protein L10
MSKYVKDLITKDLQKRLDGVSDALVVDVIGLENNKAVELRKRLRQKKINLLVVKNSLARRATEGTSLAPAFEAAEGRLALVWGGEDIISLAKEIIAIVEKKEFEPSDAFVAALGAGAQAGEPGEEEGRRRGRIRIRILFTTEDAEVTEKRMKNAKC